MRRATEGSEFAAGGGSAERSDRGGALPSGTPFPVARLLVIAGAVFAAISSEFLPTGVLPEISAGLGVSESQAGLLLTAFAFTAMITAAPLTQLLLAVPRKWLLVSVLVVLAVTNLACALAPTYWWLFAARVVGGLAQGVFWGATVPYASRLVAPQDVVRAVSVTNSGATLAFVAGVPLGAAIGQAVGWRASFMIAAITVVCFAALVVLFLPPVVHRVAKTERGSGKRGDSDSAWRDPTVGVVVLLSTVALFIVTGQNVLQIYIAPWLIEVPSLEPGAIPIILFIGGLVGAGGLVIAGMIGDRHPRAGLIGVVVAVLVGLVAMALFSPWGWWIVAPYVVWMTAFSVIPVLMQGLLVKGTSARIRDVASAVQASVMNAAIGGGALIGAWVIDGGGYAALPWVAAGVITVGLLVALSARPRVWSALRQGER